MPLKTDMSEYDVSTYTIRRRGASTNEHKPHNEVGAAHSKIASAEVPVRIKVFTPESVRQIQSWRAEQNLTQKQLDQRCAFPPNTLNGLESRKVGPTSSQLQRLNSLMKTGLTLE